MGGWWMWLWMCANKTHERLSKELIDGSGCSDGDYCSMRLFCTRKGKQRQWSRTYLFGGKAGG